VPLRDLVSRITLLKVAGGQARRARDLVVRETLLRIVLDGREIVRLACLPLHLEDLALGFLLAEGYITGLADLRRWSLKGETFSAVSTAKRKSGRGVPTLLSGCGGAISRRALDAPLPSLDRRVDLMCQFPLDRILKCSAEFQALDRVHTKTGGSHSAAVGDARRILFCTSDIGRHNALQKVIGWALRTGVPLQDKAAYVTGRISAEIVLHCAAAEIPVLVSRAAPTSLALERTLEAGLTLVGFARGGRCNIYAHPERLT